MIEFSTNQTSCDQVKYMIVSNGFSDGKYFSINILSLNHNKTSKIFYFCVGFRVGIFISLKAFHKKITHI